MGKEQEKTLDFASMFTLRKDGRYQGSYLDGNGQRKYVYDRDPERLYEKLNKAIQPKIITFKQVSEEWQRKHREEITTRTWRNYEPYYLDAVNKYGDVPIEKMNAGIVDRELKVSKDKGMSRSVVNTIRSLYRMIFDYAIVKGYILYNPVLAVKLPKGLRRGRRKAPTEDQVRIIMGSYEAPFGLFPLFLLCTGLRKSEALALTWDDIDFVNREINVDKSLEYLSCWNPKVKEPKTEAGIRTVPIVDLLIGPLASAKNSSESKLLFPTPDGYKHAGKYMTQSAFEGQWYAYCKAVGLVNDDGLPALTAHNLRHGMATLMFEANVDELTVKKIMGHSRIEVTREVYTDLRVGQERKSISALNENLNSLMLETVSKRRK